MPVLGDPSDNVQRRLNIYQNSAASAVDVINVAYTFLTLFNARAYNFNFNIYVCIWLVLAGPYADVIKDCNGFI